MPSPVVLRVETARQTIIKMASLLAGWPAMAAISKMVAWRRNNSAVTPNAARPIRTKPTTERRMRRTRSSLMVNRSHRAAEDSTGAASRGTHCCGAPSRDADRYLHDCIAHTKQENETRLRYGHSQNYVLSYLGKNFCVTNNKRQLHKYIEYDDNSTAQR